MVNFGESGESYPIECIYRYMYHVRSFESDARWRSDGTVRIAWIVLPNDYAATAVLSRAIGDGRRVSGHSAAVLDLVPRPRIGKSIIIWRK